MAADAVPKPLHVLLGIFECPDWARDYDVVIHDQCTADVKDVPYVQNILKAHQRIPGANLHRAMRCFSTGPGHEPWTVADDRYLELVTRGLLWACEQARPGVPADAAHGADELAVRCS